jgi:hypothetical protein
MRIRGRSPLWPCAYTRGRRAEDLDRDVTAADEGEWLLQREEEEGKGLAMITRKG